MITPEEGRLIKPGDRVKTTSHNWVTVEIVTERGIAYNSGPQLMFTSWAGVIERFAPKAKPGVLYIKGNAFAYGTSQGRLRGPMSLCSIGEHSFEFHADWTEVPE